MINYCDVKQFVEHIVHDSQFVFYERFSSFCRGEKILILYDPGKFPALLEHAKTKQLYRRNGGVPQEGNLQEHLNLFTEHVDQMVPKNFSGKRKYVTKEAFSFYIRFLTKIK